MLIRSFIAIEINEEIRENIRKLTAKLCTARADIKWVAAENLHITLKFLGYITDEDVANVNKIIRESVEGIKPFDLSIEGVGGFPNLKRPDVIFVGIKDRGGSLLTAHIRLDEKLAYLGIKRETRRYELHLTIGRTRSLRNLHSLADAIEPYKNDLFGHVQVDSIILMMSELLPEGPRYSRLDTITL